MRSTNLYFFVCHFLSKFFTPPFKDFKKNTNPKRYTPQVTNMRSDALFVLLVEKDAAFMRLAEDRFYNRYVPALTM